MKYECLSEIYKNKLHLKQWPLILDYLKLIAVGLLDLFHSIISIELVS